MSTDEEPYLAPYLKAARRFGAGFESLLWASPTTQRKRFAAIASMYDVRGKILLDAGCGRGDFLGFLQESAIPLAHYIGIEGVEPLAAAAEQRRGLPIKIVRADFVREPSRLFVGADVVIFSGSFNAMDDAPFYSTLRRAYDAASEAVVFNFLCSCLLAGRDYLHWRRPEDVLEFVQQFCGNVSVKDDYLDGDMTICLAKSANEPTRQE